MAASHIFTVFDVETTGLDPQNGHRIIEIAALKLVNGVIHEDQKFITLVNPERLIPLDAFQISRISDDMVATAPIMKDVFPTFLDFIGDSTIVAHNAQFDIGFLEMELKRSGLSVKLPKHLCTLEISKRIFSYQTTHNLDIVMKRMDVVARGDRHRAFNDVMATAEVLNQFLKYRPDCLKHFVEK